jgi:hypothetical protein
MRTRRRRIFTCSTPGYDHEIADCRLIDQLNLQSAIRNPQSRRSLEFG